jgi:hypothetical protein
VGEAVCFVLNPVTKSILDIMPAKEADDIVSVSQDETAQAILIEDYEGIDLEDEEDSNFAEEEFDYLFDEEEAYAYGIPNQGQRPEGAFDFECGESGSQILEPGDYFADEDSVDTPDGPEN